MGKHSSCGGRPLNLPALLSALLIAFAVEFDNEFEHRLPHRTTRHGRSPGAGPRPWLVSMAMWVHIMRLVPATGVSVGDLAHRSQLAPKSTRSAVKRLSQWWGYLDVRPDPADRRAKPPASAWVVRPTRAGQVAQDIWAPLTGEIEARWEDRFGPKVVDELRSTLGEVVECLDVDPPDFLPVGEPRLPPRARLSGKAQLALTAGLSKVLLALALDFDRTSNLSLDIYTATVGSRLPICANVLRLIGDDGLAVAELPQLSGVAKMAVDNWVASLGKHSYLEVATESGGRRRVATLTPEGTGARDSYLEWTGSLESRWPGAPSPAVLERLRRAAEHIVGGPGPGSLLWKGMEPYEDGWRSHVPPRQALPHFPVLTHKGGFPDGS